MADVGNRLKGAFEQLEDGDVSLELADLCELEFCVGPGGTSVRSPWLGLDIAEFDLAIFLGFGAVVERGAFRALTPRDPDAGHGLLLAPLAIWLAWRAGLAPRRGRQPKGAAPLSDSSRVVDPD